MDFFDFLIGVKKVKIFHCYFKKKCILDNIEHAAASGGGDFTVVCTSEFRVKKSCIWYAEKFGGFKNYSYLCLWKPRGSPKVGKIPMQMEDTNKKFVVYYASEENGFEEMFVGGADTVKECKAMVAADMKNNGLSEFVDEINGSGWEGLDNEGYHIVYSIGIGETCLSYIYGLQEDFEDELEDY